MPNPSTVIVTTGKAGPAGTVSGLTITGVTDIDWRMANSILQVQAGSQYKEFDIAATATVTMTISAGVATLTINQ